MVSLCSIYSTRIPDVGFYLTYYDKISWFRWTSKIIPLIRMTETSLNNNSPPETMTNNCIHNRSDDSMDSALPSSPSANTLPRTFHNKGLFVNVTRQGSLSRNFRSATPSEFLSHSSAANSVEDMKSLKTVRWSLKLSIVEIFSGLIWAVYLIKWIIPSLLLQLLCIPLLVRNYEISRTNLSVR